MIRLFSEYTGETPFEYASRLRLGNALKELRDNNKSVTDIALDAGFSTPSSFNKKFKKLLAISPTEFRSCNKDEKNEIINSLSSSKSVQDIKGKLDLDLNFQIVERSASYLLTLETSGEDFGEIAPTIWPSFLEQLGKCNLDLAEAEFMGISLIDEKSLRVYKAAVGFEHLPQNMVCSLKQETVLASKYASFILKGSYEGIWPSFSLAFQRVHEEGIAFSQAPSIEKYLNDPRETEEKDLLTEILIPIIY